MKKCSQCGLAEEIRTDKCDVEKATSDALDEGANILKQMQKLTDESEEFQKLQPELRDKLYSDLERYQMIYQKIKDNQIGIITRGAQKDDADLNVMVENYQFVMWSIIAIMAIIITMKLVKKQN